MKGSEFLRSLPEKPGLARERLILDAVRSGLAVPISWAPVETAWREHVGTLYVATDALAIGDAEDQLRVTVSHTSAQRIADVLGAQLPTPHISDLAFSQAEVVLPPCIQAWDSRSRDTSRMVRHHNEVESLRAGRPGLVRCVGKDWVLTNKLAGRPERSASYGWHSPRAPYQITRSLRAWQDVITRHDRHYVDYAQVLCLVRRTMVVDGVERELDDVLRSPDLWGLVSREGPLLFTRHPGVPSEASAEFAAAATQDAPAKVDSPGARALRLAEAELAAGVHEDPIGSNTGRRVREYLRACVRDRRLPDGSVEQFRLGLTRAEWCAAFASWCAFRANAEGDLPHAYRASVAELWRDAVASGAARPPSHRPRAGDLGIYARSGGDPTKGGRGHVARVCAEPDGDGAYETIDGNHNHRVERVRRVLGDCVGWVAYGDAPGAPTAADLESAAWLVRLAAEVEAPVSLGPRASEAVEVAPFRFATGATATARAVIIDPGHGGSGSTLDGSSPNNAAGPRGTLEKDLTLDLALRAARALAGVGVGVALTRDSDVNLGLADRAAVARDAHARVFVSIHFNGDASPSVQGTETWVHPAAADDSRLLARSVQQRLAAATGYRDRGIRVNDLGVLDPARHHPSTAACLAEISFLTAPGEETRLADAGYRDALAATLARGVTDYLAGAGGVAPGSLDEPVWAAAEPSFDTRRAEYETLYHTCVIAQEHLPAIDAVVTFASEHQARYESVSAVLGVPWYFVAVVHSLEGGARRFATHLHNGDPLTARTVHVPAGRPQSGSPPYIWEQSAEDALRMKGLHRWRDWTLAGLLYQLERYNGFGYRNVRPPIHSPYLWSFSNHYTKGKYVADGRYDPNAVSRQCGGAAVLLRMEQRKVIPPLG